MSLIIRRNKVLGTSSNGLSPIFAPALLFCLEPQKGKPLEECVLKSPGGKVEEGENGIVKGIVRTAQEELEQELGIGIDEQSKFRYLESIPSTYNGITKSLHLVLCDIGDSKINVDNNQSEKKTIIGSEGQKVQVSEIYQPIWLTRDELLMLLDMQSAHITQQVRDITPYIIEHILPLNA